MRRKAAVITDNMAKLVDNPLDAAVFLPRLLPDLEKMAKEISDPEARSVAEKARETLIRVGADGKEAAAARPLRPGGPRHHGEGPAQGAGRRRRQGLALQDVTDYVVAAALALSDAKVFEIEEWACLGPLVESLFSGADAADKAAAVSKAFVRACEVAAEDKAEEDDDDVGVDLCNCEFSLAYGGKILLNNARLRLKRGLAVRPVRRQRVRQVHADARDRQRAARGLPAGVGAAHGELELEWSSEFVFFSRVS